MAHPKGKSRDDQKREKGKASFKSKGGKLKKKTTERKGPRLPNSLRKEVERLNPRAAGSDDDEEVVASDDEVLGGQEDVYEFEEEIPEEESKKNRRFDPVENLDYELPEDFKDEDVSSDDDVRDDGDDGRMLPSENRSEGKKRKITDHVISEAYPESEFNPTRDVLEGQGAVKLEDLLETLQGKPDHSKLKRQVKALEKKSEPILPPLSNAMKEQMERKAVKDEMEKELRKWEAIIKRNREAPTIYFDEDRDLGPSTVGTIAAEFKPRTKFEKEMAAVFKDNELMDAHRNDGLKMLEFNKVSIEDEMERQGRIAKMRSLLFRHELKAKHIKKIKSKTYHRLLKKDKLKANSIEENHTDPEAAKQLAMKQEYERAKERMTQRHKGSSKWSQHIKVRGLERQDDGTRIAIAEQHSLHAQLTRKMNSLKDSSDSSSDDISDDDDDDEYDDDDKIKDIEKAKEKTLKLLDEDDEVPNSGLHNMSFMKRRAEKRKAELAKEVELTLQEFESLEDPSGVKNPKEGRQSGRMVFNASGKEAPETSKKTKTDIQDRSDNYYGDSDSEDDFEPKESTDVEKDKNNDDSANQNYSFFKSFENNPGPQTTHEVSIFAEGEFRKMKSGSDGDAKKSPRPSDSVVLDQNVQEPVEDLDEGSDADSEGPMVDGVLSEDPESFYELPSQQELIRDAFAADNVEDEFEKDKQAILNEENPEPEKPVLLPGWGQWTKVQKKKGIPSYLQEQHEFAKKKREEAVKQRKDAKFKHVVFSEKTSKKAVPLFVSKLPYPFRDKDSYEGTIRKPLAPESNPITVTGDLYKPSVVKKSGVVIEPIKFEQVNAYEKPEGHKKTAQKRKKNENKNNSKNKNNCNSTNKKAKAK